MAQRILESEKKNRRQYGLGISPSFKGFSAQVFMMKRKEFKCAMDVNVPKGVLYYKDNDLSSDVKERFFAKLVRKDNEHLFASHYGSIEKIVYIYIPANMNCMMPVTLRTSQEQGAGAVHYIIVAGENSKAVIIEELEMDSKGYAMSTVHEMYIEEGAKIEYYHSKQMGEKSFNFNTTVCSVGRKANFKIAEFLNGGSFVQHSYTSMIENKEAQNEYMCGFVAPQQAEYDIFGETVHCNQDTKSMMVVKGIVADDAKVISRSKIKIEKEALRTQSQERADILLLGEKARGDVVPMLEVNNKDVVCAHGSTVSRLNEEQLFYMNSRGLNEEEARVALSVAFVSSIMDTFPDDINEKMVKKVSEQIQ